MSRRGNILRRLVLGAVFCAGLSTGALAAANAAADDDNNPGTTLVLTTTKGQVQVQYFAAPGKATRPAILLLHGASASDDADKRFGLYADGLNALGVDVYGVFYYNGDEKDLMASQDNTVREQTYASHFAKWVQEVREVMSFALSRPNANGKLGLIGFSNGATLAIATAGIDQRVTTVVEFYGSYPPFQINRLPPLQIIHGDADTVVPLKAAQDLAAFCKSKNVPFQMLIYPHAGHGFDIGGAAGSNSRQRALRFILGHIRK